MSLVRSFLLAIAVAVAILFVADRVFFSTFPTFMRLRYSFSAAYLTREIDRLRSRPGTVVLGDSTLWGFGVEERAAAISRIKTLHPDWTNLSYPGGGPVNTLAMLRVLLANGVRPVTVVFNVNEKQFNSSDSAFARLYPAVEQLAWPVLTDRDREDVTKSLPETADAKIDRAFGLVWSAYGMRTDLRDALFGDVDAAHAVQNMLARVSGAAATTARDHRPTADKFEGTYDLSPLDDTNSSFRALMATAALVRSQHIRTIAILTPTNHRLLHDFIDVPAYRRNLAFVRTRLEAYGITVLDLDGVFSGAEFIDNDHLTAAGNEHLASLLAARVTP